MLERVKKRQVGKLVKYFSKSFVNPIDNRVIVWYNQSTIQGTLLDESVNTKGGSSNDP